MGGESEVLQVIRTMQSDSECSSYSKLLEKTLGRPAWYIIIQSVCFTEMPEGSIVISTVSTLLQ